MTSPGPNAVTPGRRPSPSSPERMCGRCGYRSTERKCPTCGEVREAEAKPTSVRPYLLPEDMLAQTIPCPWNECGAEAGERCRYTRGPMRPMNTAHVMRRVYAQHVAEKGTYQLGNAEGSNRDE